MSMLSHHFFIGGDPTILGWLITLLYLALAAQSYRSWQLDRHNHQHTHFWHMLFVLFLALGINKQLDLQTGLLIGLRYLALMADLQSQKTLLKILFVSFSAAVLAGGFWLARRRLVDSVKQHRIIWLGLLLLFIFVFARVVTFNRLFAERGETFSQHWSGIFELFALLVIAYGVMRDAVITQHAANRVDIHSSSQPSSVAYVSPDTSHAACPQCGALTQSQAVEGRTFKCKQCAWVFTVHLRD